MKRLAILGAGGHAKVVASTALALGWEVTLCDDDPSSWGRQLLGIAIAGPCVPQLADPAATCVLAIGHNATRRALAATAACRFATLVHPSAVVHASVELGVGTVVFAGAVVQPDTRIGPHGIINTGASVDHDCILGEAVHIAPGARLAGGVAVGDGAFIGIGAVAVPNVTIGAYTTVGAGAVVVGDLPAHVVAMGVPARRKP